MTRRWQDLSVRTRRMIIAGAFVEGLLKTAMLIDLRRRPADQIKGSKRVWSAATLINSAGLIPLAYFVLGRRRLTD
jgi:hypothetical protein